MSLIGLLIALAAPLVLPDLDLPGRALGWAMAGLVLSWLGIWLRMWSILTLGRYFRRVVVVQRDHRVIRRGPYRLVRHPSYTGLLLFWLGLGVAQVNLVSVAALAILPTIAVVRRILVEEAALLDGLGEDYRSYAEGRPRLLPGVW